jgi:ketosteroid isomerase-like protein
VWHYPGKNQLSGDHVGREATFAMFAREFELTGGTLRPEFHDALGNDEHVVALLHTTAQKETGTLDQGVALIFHIADAKITEAWTLWTDPDAADEFWGQSG